MTTTELVSKFFPLALAIIMFSLGLSLTTRDFKSIAKEPKIVFAALMAQIFALPVLAYLLIKLFNLPAELAIGLMILAASPGGITANIFSHLAKGDVALNISLTAINSILAAITLPLFVKLSLALFSDSTQEIAFQTRKMIEVFVIVLVPVAVGMLANQKFPTLKSKIDKSLQRFSILFLVFIIAAALMNEYEMIRNSITTVGGIVITFNILSMLLGYGLGGLLNVSKGKKISLMMEIGIHNVTLALYVAYQVLQNSAFAVPSALYGISMYIVAACSLLLLKKTKA